MIQDKFARRRGFGRIGHCGAGGRLSVPRDLAMPVAAIAPRPEFMMPLNRDSLVLEFEDDFDGTELDTGKWVPAYLAHWSARQAALARYTIENSALTLRVDPDQAPWCLEFDGKVKVSSLQTGQCSGPIGSGSGQHRFRPGLVVREEQLERRLYTPTYGYIELRARAELGPGHLAALWMIGFENRPEDSGEITVMEIFGRNISAHGTRLGHGIKRINDSRLEQEFFEPLLPFDPADWHVYGADWTPGGVDFYLDGQTSHPRCAVPPLSHAVDAQHLRAARPFGSAVRSSAELLRRLCAGLSPQAIRASRPGGGAPRGLPTR